MGENWIRNLGVSKVDKPGFSPWNDVFLPSLPLGAVSKIQIMKKKNFHWNDIIEVVSLLEFAQWVEKSSTGITPWPLPARTQIPPHLLCTEQEPQQILLQVFLGLSFPPGWDHQNIPGCAQGLEPHKSISHLGLLSFYLLTAISGGGINTNQGGKGKSEGKESWILITGQKWSSHCWGIESPGDVALGELGQSWRGQSWGWLASMFSEGSPSPFPPGFAQSAFQSSEHSSECGCAAPVQSRGSRAGSGTWLVPGISLE